MILALLTSCLLGMLGANSSGHIEMDSTELVVSDTVQIVSIGPTVSPLTVHIRMVGNGYAFAHYLSIVVLKCVPNSSVYDTVQVISEGEETGYNAYFVGPEEVVEFKDINFDGYTDLMYVSNVGNQGVNQVYSIWLFNKDLQRFELNEEFSETVGCNPVIDSESQSITSGGLNGCFGNCYSTEVYEVQNNHLILVDELAQELDPEGRLKDGEPLFIFIHKKRIHGTMVTVKRVVGTLEELVKYQ
jgi:hypothetical protein